MDNILENYYLAKNDSTFAGKIRTALKDAIDITRRNIPKFASGDVYPSTNYYGENYAKIRNGGEGSDMWTEGFWPGRLWLCYEETGEDAFRDLAEKNLKDFYRRLDRNINVDWTHDIGFLYTPSAVAPYKITGDEFARKTALEAAFVLSRRFRAKGEFIQSMGCELCKEYYRAIADTMMNLPLLFWAAEEANVPKYREYAEKHAKTTIKYLLRENGGVYHHFLFNNVDGEPLHGLTLQGAGDESYWSRAQAWVVYGFAIAYSYVKEDYLKDAFFRTCDFYISRLPKDYIPYWDFIFDDDDGEPKDSSAAAIWACGVMEMARHLPHEGKMNEYLQVLKKTMESLISDKYAIRFSANEEGLLAHTTPDKPRNEYDLCSAYGDYFYLEALVRASRNWKMYW